MPGIARRGDLVTATDVHKTPNGLASFPFSGPLQSDLVSSVVVNGLPVAVNGSVAMNVLQPHPGTNRGTVIATRPVTAGGKPVAAQGDMATTCNDPKDLPVGTVNSGSPDVTVG